MVERLAGQLSCREFWRVECVRSDAAIAAPLRDIQRAGGFKQSGGFGDGCKPERNLGGTVRSRSLRSSTDKSNATGRRADGDEVRVPQRTRARVTASGLLHPVREHPRGGARLRLCAGHSSGVCPVAVGGRGRRIMLLPSTPATRGGTPRRARFCNPKGLRVAGGAPPSPPSNNCVPWPSSACRSKESVGPMAGTPLRALPIEPGLGSSASAPGKRTTIAARLGGSHARHSWDGAEVGPTCGTLQNARSVARTRRLLGRCNSRCLTNSRQVLASPSRWTSPGG